MTENMDFIDLYARLQVRPDCDEKILEKAYHHFALKYHPDQAETADVGKFQEVVDAYTVLRDTEKRADYNKQYAAHHGDNVFAFPGSEDTALKDSEAVADADAHQRILMYLYKQRRENAEYPGILGYFVQRMLGCSQESFDFHVWYLKSKGLIGMTEQAELAITIEGVDHVISMSRTAEAEKLLIAQAKPQHN